MKDYPVHQISLKLIYLAQHPVTIFFNHVWNGNLKIQFRFPDFFKNLYLLPLNQFVAIFNILQIISYYIF